MKTWENLFDHVGASLPIHSRPDYLKIWTAQMLKYPTKRLPFLFLYGEQASGKTMFHTALSLLLRPGEYVQADSIIGGRTPYTSSLEKATLCYLEGADFGRYGIENLRPFLRSEVIIICRKYKETLTIPNRLHWIQCGTQGSQAPKLFDTTRIYLSQPEEVIPVRVLLSRLREEAKDFSNTLLALDTKNITLFAV